jgi:hypothetical protein
LFEVVDPLACRQAHGHVAGKEANGKGNDKKAALPIDGEPMNTVAGLLVTSGSTNVDAVQSKRNDPSLLEERERRRRTTIKLIQTGDQSLLAYP